MHQQIAQLQYTVSQLEAENAGLRTELDAMQHQAVERTSELIALREQLETEVIAEKLKVVEVKRLLLDQMRLTNERTAECIRLREQLAAAQKDAERYQKFIAVCDTTSDDEPALHAKLDAMLCHPSKDAFDKLFDSIDLAAIEKEKAE